MKAKGYLVLESVFILLVLAAAARFDAVISLPWPYLVVLAVFGPFAVFRAARTISYNKVMEWAREPFCEVVKDSSGAGEAVEPKDGYNPIGELLACPICSGTWAAAALFVLFSWWPAAGAAFILILGLAGISEFVHWMAERNEWQGREAREAAGSAWMEKNNVQLLDEQRYLPAVPAREYHKLTATDIERWRK